MKRTWIHVAAAMVLVVALAGCGKPAAKSAVSPRPVSASGSVDGLDVVLSLPSAILKEGTLVRATVKATNTTAATISTRAIFRWAITDSGGRVVYDTNWELWVIMGQPIPASKAYTTARSFTVPPAGRYALSLPEVTDAAGQPLSVSFVSVK